MSYFQTILLPFGAPSRPFFVILGTMLKTFGPYLKKVGQNVGPLKVRVSERQFVHHFEVLKMQFPRVWKVKNPKMDPPWGVAYSTTPDPATDYRSAVEIRHFVLDYLHNGPELNVIRPVPIKTHIRPCLETLMYI